MWRSTFIAVVCSLIIAGGVTAGTGWIIKGAQPQLYFHDSNQTDLDNSAIIGVNCPGDTGSGSEDCDLFIRVLEAGTMTTRININADGGMTMGDSNNNSVVWSTDNATMTLDGTANTLELSAATTATAIFIGSDAADAANTTFDTTGAGAIVLGSADVTTLDLINNGAMTVGAAATTDSLALESAGAVTIEATGAINIGDASATSVPIITDGGTVTIDGFVQADVPLLVITTAATLTVNTVHIATTDATTHIVPACVAANLGEWVTVVVGDVSEAISLSLADASNRFVVSGVDTSAAAHELDSPTAAVTSGGASVTLTCLVAEFWHSTAITGVWLDGN